MTSHLNKIILTLFLGLQFFVNAQTLDKDGIPNVPQPYALVNDFANLLSTENKQALENKLLAYNDSTTTQIYVITITSMGDYSIEDYALRLGRKWGIGQKDKNNGILILVSKNDRKVDIEVGYGLEGTVTDYDTKHIIDELMVPAFKQSNYYLGINEATDKLIGLMQGTYKAGENVSHDSIPIWAYFLIAFIIFFVLLPAIFSRNKGIRGGGSSWTWGSSGGSSWSSGSSWGGGGGFGGGGGGSFGGGGSSGSW